jgi:hypothetical protein
MPAGCPPELPTGEGGFQGWKRGFFLRGKEINYQDSTRFRYIRGNITKPGIDVNPWKAVKKQPAGLTGSEAPREPAGGSTAENLLRIAPIALK